jgi:hypothetical protein
LTDADVQGADSSPRRFSRRVFLGAGAGAVVLAGASFGIDQWVESGNLPSSPVEPVRSYRSRPDFSPADVTTLVPAAGTASGLIFIGPIAGPGQFGPMIVDNLGDLVWFRPLPSGKATNLQVQSYQGQPVLAWWEGEVVTPGYGKGECVLMDSSYREITRIRAGNGLKADLHELFLTPEGTALITAYRLMEANLTSVGGPSRGTLLDSLLQEIDIATGKVLFEWDAHTHVALDESYHSVPTGGGPYDFFHINSIDVDTDGNLIVSGRHTWTAYKIDRHTGAIIWRLNGRLSDFSMAPTTQFAFQHHVRHHPGNQLTIFDDGGGPPDVDARSRGLKLELDLASMKASFVHQYLPDPTFLTTSQGSVQVLANGNVFVGWGSEPYWSEYAEDGRLLFDAQLPTGGDSYRAFRFPWEGQPVDRPTMVAERSGNGKVTAHASWNGATEVATWELLAGSGADALQRIASAPRLGFETAITARTHGSHLAMAARDATGKLLAVSPTRLV